MNIKCGEIVTGQSEFSYAVVSDKGLSRNHNEDAFLVLPSEMFFAVADGAGGYHDGQFASSLILKTVSECLLGENGQGDITQQIDDSPMDETIQSAGALKDAVDVANRALYMASRRNKMASTFIGCQIFNRSVVILHVGDSRAYLLRKGELKLLTEDHSFVWQLYKNGDIRFEELQTHPKRNVITKAMGVELNVKPSKTTLDLGEYDILLFCTDGLTSMLSDAEIEKVLRHTNHDLSKGARTLCEAANRSGGRDNITVMLIGLR